MPRNSTQAASSSDRTTTAPGGKVVVLQLYGERDPIINRERRTCIFVGEKMVRFDVHNVPEGYKHYILECCVEGSLFPPINASERHMGAKTLLRQGKSLQAVCTGPPFKGSYMFKITLIKQGSPNLSAETKVFVAQHPNKVMPKPEPRAGTPELSIEEIYEIAARSWKKPMYPTSLEIDED
ncbi:hypothetical protein MN608_09446 [Microdochium nivale]|nr:hypothetical protein MN608_09446 [Microdochium nivale]